MNKYQRAGFKWSVNEILSLQREFELLGWSIDEIAAKHKRSPDAIMHKLDYEGLADYNVLYSNYHDLNSTMPVYRKQTDALNLLSEYEDDEDDETVFDEDDDEEYFDEEYQEDDDDDDDCEDEVATLSERVEGLEESIFEIRDMIKQMMTSFTTSKQKFGTGVCV
jgi:hypothetical protein